MSSKDRRRLLQLTADAANRAPGTEPDPGAGRLFAAPPTAALGVLWVQLDDSPSRPETARFVAADLQPQAGSHDVSQGPASSSGALTLRCDVMLRLDGAQIERHLRPTGAVEPETLDAALAKRAQIEAGTLMADALEQDVDTDPVYEDWMEEGPRAALERLTRLLADSDGVAATLDTVLEDTNRERLDPGFLPWVQHLHRAATRPHLGAETAGEVQSWGLVFHREESKAVRDALAPLVDRRRARLGAASVQALDYGPEDESAGAWLARHGVAPGKVEPSKVPRHLLLVGPTDRIGVAFEQALGLEYAVGRLSFAEPSDYGRYAADWTRYVMSGEPSETPLVRLTDEHLDPEHRADLRRQLSKTRATAGLALRDLKAREVALSVDLHRLLDKRAMGARTVDEDLVRIWNERRELRRLTLLGDPALPVDDLAGAATP